MSEILPAILGSVLGGLGSFVGTNNANKTNMKINQQQIAYDREKTAGQMYWSEKMWQKENAYNTPAMQVQRLKDAGINPYFALGQITPSMQNGFPSSPSGGAPAALPAQPVDYGSLGRGIADAVSQYYNMRNMQALNRKTEAEAQSQEIHNKYLDLRNMLDLLKLKEDKSLTYTQNKYLSEQYYQLSEQHEWNNVRNQAEANQAVHMARVAEEQIENQQLQNAVLKFDIKIQPYKLGLLQNQIKEVASSVAANLASANASNKQALLNEALEDQARNLTNKYIQEKDQQEEMFPVIKESLEKHVRQQGSDYWNPFRYAGTIFGGVGAQFVKQMIK